MTEYSLWTDETLERPCRCAQVEPQELLERTFDFDGRGNVDQVDFATLNGIPPLDGMAAG